MLNYITVTSGLRGYFAVLVEQGDDGFTEPVQSSPFAYPTKEEAEKDGRNWAASEELPFK